MHRRALVRSADGFVLPMASFCRWLRSADGAIGLDRACRWRHRQAGGRRTVSQCETTGRTCNGLPRPLGLGPGERPEVVIPGTGPDPAPFSGTVTRADG